MSNITGVQALVLLQKYPKYKGKTDYQIKKEIGGSKPAVVQQLRDELTKLQKSSAEPTKDQTKKPTDSTKVSSKKSDKSKKPTKVSPKKPTKPTKVSPKKSEGKTNKNPKGSRKRPKSPEKSPKAHHKKPKVGMCVMIWDKDSYDMAIQEGGEISIGSHSDAYISQKSTYPISGTREEVMKGFETMLKIMRSHLESKGDDSHYTDDYIIENIIENIPGRIRNNKHIAYIEVFSAVAV